MKGLKSIIYFIDDVKGAGDWLEQIFKTKPFHTEERFIGFMINDFEISFHQADNKNENIIGNQVSYWEVENLEGFKSILLKSGCSIYRDTIYFGKNESICQLKSPFGFIIGLKQN